MSKVIPFQDLSELVLRHTGYNKPITRSTDLIHDIGLAGYEGELFMNAIRSSFGYSMHEEDIYSRFGDEQAMTPLCLVRWVVGSVTPLPPFTVGELHDLIQQDFSVRS